jgi:hypothetical protein
VLAKFERKEFVQIWKYRGVSKDSISVKSKVSWRNKRWRLGEIKKYREATKEGSAVKSKVSCWI